MTVNISTSGERREAEKRRRSGEEREERERRLGTPERAVEHVVCIDVL